MTEDPIKEKEQEKVEQAPEKKASPSASEPTPTEQKKEGEKPEETKQASEPVNNEDIEPTADKTNSPKKEKKSNETSPSKKKKQKKDKSKKEDKEEVDEDFNYIVRLSNSDIDGNLRVLYGLSHIKGIGRHLGLLVAEHSQVDKFKKMGNLSVEELERIQNTIDDITNIAPSWMLNHRKDMETGEDIHLISTEIELSLREELNLLKMIRCYRGIRHENRLPVRGQRTRANNRKGLSLGVSKKK